MNYFTGEGALERARRFLAEKADAVAAEHVDMIGNAAACDSESETKIMLFSPTLVLFYLRRNQMNHFSFP